MNDEQLMKQNREYYQGLIAQDKMPTKVIFTFRHVLKNIDKLKLNESKINFCIELKDMFLNLKAHWTDMPDNWSDNDIEYRKEIFMNLETYLKIFDEIIQSDKHSTEITLAEEANELSKEAIDKAKKSNKIAVFSFVCAFLSLVAAILLGVFL